MTASPTPLEHLGHEALAEFPSHPGVSSSECAALTLSKLRARVATSGRISSDTA
ncbi:hypothetical protein [Deinococcus ruber]|uniref:hypothetical protein n=1 Tax=Deinococcus ruber TaxID=1848197 RepID=UPI0016655B6C|nr:hypothetical protein [Deinococcus ruber]